MRLLVTGGARGIGLATARAVLARGGSVALLDVDLPPDLGERSLSLVADVNLVGALRAAPPHVGQAWLISSVYAWQTEGERRRWRRPTRRRSRGGGAGPRPAGRDRPARRARGRGVLRPRRRLDDARLSRDAHVHALLRESDRARL